jgi:alpha-ketoglutarate-dependent taurine dioxygenase
MVWDNAQLLHAAPLADPAAARTLWRITVQENLVTPAPGK